MFKLRLRIAILVAWLFLFFNIERINEPIDIASFVYVLVTLCSAILVLQPKFFYGHLVTRLVAPSLVIYAIAKYFLGYTIFGTGLALTVTEIIVITLTIYLVGQLAEMVVDFENAVEDLTFRQVGLPPKVFENTQTEELYREVKRSRRFDYTLSLLILKPDINSDQVKLNKIMMELQKRMTGRYIQARVAQILSDTLRDCDLIAVEESEFVILLPEVTAEEVDEYKSRIEENVANELGIDVRFGVANFPDNGITLNGLVEIAASQLEESESKAAAKKNESAQPAATTVRSY